MNPLVLTFLLLTLVAPIAVVQAWIANGRPKSAALWMLYSGGPLAVVLMASFIPESFRLRQALIDGFWGVQLAAYLVGAEVFLRRPPSSRAWLMGPAFAVVSGIPYLVAPGSVLADVSGAVVISTGYLLVTYRLSALGAPAKSRVLRDSALAGAIFHSLRMVALVIGALSGRQTYDLINAVTGAVVVFFVIYHGLLLASLIQRRSFDGLIATSRKLDRSLFERQNNRLIASVAHRISTPVATLKAIAPLLRDEIGRSSGIPERDRSRMLELVSGIDRAGDSLADTLRQYQALSLIPEDEEPRDFDIVEILRTLIGSEHMTHLATLSADDGITIPVHGPQRRTLQLFAVLLEQQRLLGWSGPERNLRLSAERGARGPLLRISGMHVDPDFLRDLDRINHNTRLDMVSAARAMSYAWNQLRELYAISNQSDTDPMDGTQSVVWRFGGLQPEVRR